MDSSERNKFLKKLDFFFKELNCNEIEQGIIENHQIPLKLWKEGIDIFDSSESYITSIKNISSSLTKPNSYIKYLLNFLFGGTIRSVSQKIGNMEKINEIKYICPDCLNNGFEIKLEKSENLFKCFNCSKKYIIRDGVLFLFKTDSLQKLYPELIGI